MKIWIRFIGLKVAELGGVYVIWKLMQILYYWRWYRRPVYEIWLEAAGIIIGLILLFFLIIAVVVWIVWNWDTANRIK